MLVAGIGNILLGDDGFGVHVARALAGDTFADGVSVADFGIRGVHLAYELADGDYDAVILIDAVPRGGTPGTLHVIEPEIAAAEATAEAADAHSLTPAAVLAWVARLGRKCPPVTIVGCEPGTIDESLTLSEPVAAAVDRAAQLVRELVAAQMVKRPQAAIDRTTRV